MKFSYNKKIDALYIRFNDKPIIESDQVSDSIIIDYDKNGEIVKIMEARLFHSPLNS